MKHLAFLGMLLCLVLPTLAQNDDLAREAALSAAQQRLGTRALTWSYEILQPTTLASLTCPTGPGGDLGRQVVPYRYTVTYATGNYTVYVSSDGTTVVLCDEKFNLPAATPTVTPGGALPTATLAATALGTPAGAVCLVTASGAFVNVRATPNRDAAQVGQIFSGQPYSVLVRNSNTSDVWYYITPGWVSAQVIQTSGAACAGLPVDDARIGSGVGITAPTTDTNLAQVLQTYTCPTGFTGYLEPRIRVGTATAKLEAGGIPNVIRSQPIANDSIGARLGTIQPNRTIDRVVNGPACSGGYVWWLVAVDGVQGWTAESDNAQDEYFLEPIGNTALSTPSAPASGTLGNPTGQVLQRRDDTSGAVFVGISPDSQFALASDTIVASDATETQVIAEYTLDAASPTFTDSGMALPTLVSGLQVLADGRVAVSDATGITLFRKEGSEYAQDNVLSGVFDSAATARAWAFSDDGRLYATVQADDSGRRLVLRSLTAEAPLWTADLPGESVPFRVAFSPDTQTIAVLSFDGVTLFDSITGVQQAVLSNATEQFGMLDMAFDPTDPTRLLTSICKRVDATQTPAPCASGEITLWSLTDNQIIGVVETNAANPLHIAYAPDSSRIYIADSSGIVVVRDGAGTVLETLDASGDRDISIVDMAVSRDGRSLLVSVSAGEIVWFTVTE